ncbi:MAG: hypothetical protein RIS34_1168 [Pseudomonadota bacterium]|jgi:hypothetical protein
MPTLTLFAPYFITPENGVAGVKTLDIKMTHPWQVYAKYGYIYAAHPRVQRIPCNAWGDVNYAVQQLQCAARTVHFIDVTGCTVTTIDRSQRLGSRFPTSHRHIPELGHMDHVTYWWGPDGEPITLVEPYTIREDLQAEINSRGLCGMLLPHRLGLYSGGGDATSVLLANANDATALSQIKHALQNSGNPIWQVNDLSFSEALLKSKGRSK